MRLEANGGGKGDEGKKKPRGLPQLPGNVSNPFGTTPGWEQASPASRQIPPIGVPGEIKSAQQESSEEDADRIVVSGTNLPTRMERQPDIAFHIQKSNKGFEIKTSIIDVSSLVKKDDRTDRQIKDQKVKSTGKFFLPKAFFANDKENPAITVSFSLSPDEYGILRIANPDIELSKLQLQTFQSTGGQSTDLEELAEQLAYRKTAVEQNPSTIRKRRRSSDPLINLGDDTSEITDEVIAQYTIDHGIPVIYKYRHPNNQWEYDVTPNISDKVLLVETTQPKKKYVAIVNARNIIAYKQGKPFPYAASELAEISGELNDHALQRKNKKALTIQEKRERTRLAHMNKEEFKALSKENFRQVCVAVLQNEILPFNSPTNRIVQNELTRRMNKGEAHVRDVYDVLFTIPNLTGEYDELQEQAIVALYKTPNYAPIVLDIFRSKSNSRMKIKTTSGQRNGREVFETSITLRDDDMVITSEVFRSKDNKETSINLAKANILSQIIEIPSDLDADLLKKAGRERGLPLVKAETARVITQKELKRDNIHARNLSEYCESNGFELNPAQNVFYPGDKTPYATRIEVKIGDITIVKESRGYTQDSTERQATRKLLSQLKGPQTGNVDFPNDVATSVADLARQQNIPEPQTQIVYTTNTQGKNLAHCVVHAEGTNRYTFVGTDVDENRARRLALEKLYTVLQKEADQQNP